MSPTNGIFKIEDDVPPPVTSRNNATPAGDAIRSLMPGQSVVIPDDALKDISATVAAIKKATKRSFATRAVEGGRRVWRLA